jgi:serine/threonine protein kinase
MKIAVDMADALQYIHHDCESPIIHCDLKPINILLDYDMTAHLGDFGIAGFYMKSKSAPAGDSSSIGTITLKGTIGYIAPGNKYVSSCKFSYAVPKWVFM